MLSKNLKCNRGRMEIKRIISVMANKELRKNISDFKSTQADTESVFAFSSKNIQEKLSMINVGGGCGEFVIINMNEIRRK